jgi:hypothetical protein
MREAKLQRWIRCAIEAARVVVAVSAWRHPAGWMKGVRKSGHRWPEQEPYDYTG